MSTEKDQSQKIKINTKIIKFPNVKNEKQLKQQKLENAKLV